MATHDAYQEYLKITDAVINDAFAGANFGRTDFRTILAEVVIKRAAGYHCGHTATTIAKKLKLLTGKSEKPLERCAAGRDGECHHKDCPQLRDNEPMATGRHCPIDNWDDE